MIFLEKKTNYVYIYIIYFLILMTKTTTTYRVYNLPIELQIEIWTFLGEHPQKMASVLDHLKMTCFIRFYNKSIHCKKCGQVRRPSIVKDNKDCIINIGCGYSIT